MKYEILPLRTAFLWIAASAILISGSAAVGLWVYKWHARQVAMDDRYKIIALLQHTLDPEPLQSVYLSEILNLSIDKPAYLTSYQTKSAEQLLLKCPHIHSVRITKIPPGTLYVDYAMRRPVAFLAEYFNVAVGKDGVAIPFKPFYTPKNLPDLVLGDIENDIRWGESVGSSRFSLALAVLGRLSSPCCKANVIIKRIDVSRIDASSAGRREILVTLEETIEGLGHTTRYLRLGIDHYEGGLQNYWALRQHMLAHKQDFITLQMIIDLRVPQLAFLSAVH